MVGNCHRTVATAQRTRDGELVPERESKPVEGHSMSRYTQPIQGDPVEVTLLENLHD